VTQVGLPHGSPTCVNGPWRPQPAYVGNANRELPCEGVVARGSRATTTRVSAEGVPASAAERSCSSQKSRMQFPLVSFRYALKTLELQRSDFKV